MLENICNDILKNDITVIASRPINGKVQLTLNILYELGIKQKKHITMFQLDDPSSFYVEKLVSLISQIDDKKVHHYFHPCQGLERPFVIKSEFITAIEQISQSNINMCDLSISTLSIDIIDYILEYDEEHKTDVIIINTFDSVIKKSQYTITEILKKIKNDINQYQTHVIFLCHVEQISEIKKTTLHDICYYQELKKAVDTMMLTYRLKENNQYTNQLEILIGKDKVEKKQCYYNEQTNEIKE